MKLDSEIRGRIVGGAVHAGFFSFLTNILVLTTPIYLLQIYDRVLASFSLETLIYISIIAVAALCFLGAMEMVRSMYFQRMASDIDREFGGEAIQIALRAGAAGQLDAQPMRDLATVRSFISARGLGTLFDLPFAPLFVAVLYLIHPVLFWLTLGGIAVLLIVAALNQLGIRDASALASEKNSSASTTAMAFAGNADTIRAMGMRRGVIEVWGKTFAEATQANDRAATINSMFGSVSRTLRMILQIAILGVGAWLVLLNEMTAGMIFAAAIISGRALQPIDQLVGGWRGTVEAWRAWLRLTGMMTRAAKAPDEKRTILPELRGRIVARDLTYAPPGVTNVGEAIIKRISFAIEPGEAIAIVGPSRAGKSTLSKLIVGVLTPSSGEIRIDGTDLKNWDESQIGPAIGYLGQDVQLIAGTVAQNICRFDAGASDAAITDAAVRAQAHEIILSLRDAYQTQIGAVGGQLSGGERQRIGLARAFYGSPRILVLDEPNANLDSEGEVALEKALAGARKSGATVIIVTHRLSIAAACDKVLAIRRGVIEAFGPSHQVLQQMQRGSAVVPMHRPHPAAAPKPQTGAAEANT